ncbi:Hypothetical protein CINCED_3A003000 [Cinara cedri]|uniref:Uncharacterized protein n=1 Tax=Cinara cedri TaxID=506608 RepID=A0A5E4MG71_9HEMI|nr:Hypothetical protein CINCED_3A003000 [Cinara cedri]
MLSVKHFTSDANAGITGWREPMLPQTIVAVAGHVGRLLVSAEFLSKAEWFRGGCHWSDIVTRGKLEKPNGLASGSGREPGYLPGAYSVS